MGSYRREAGSFLSISVLDYLIGSTVREELDLWFHGYNQGPVSLCGHLPGRVFLAF